jgi:predicted ArsR family transcriptional regulator/TusA-related sulfurtransferase
MTVPALTLPERHRDRPTVSVAKALGSATRAGIFEHLRAADGPATVRDIAEAFGVHPNVARSHLETLVDAGLVEAGRRKNPAGGRPANVYRTRRGGAAPAVAGGGSVPAAELLVCLLGKLLDHSGDQQALPARAYEVAVREGRRLTADLDRREELEPAVATAVEVLASYSPEARLVRSGDGWVDVAGVAALFAGLDSVRPEVVDALARGLTCGAVAGLGVVVTAADAGSLPGGEPVWRLRPAQASPASGADAARTVDTRRLHREAGVVEAMRAVTVLSPGQVLEVLTEGPGSPAAFARWADRAGHQLLRVDRAADASGRPAIRLLIRKGG